MRSRSEGSRSSSLLGPLCLSLKKLWSPNRRTKISTISSAASSPSLPLCAKQPVADSLSPSLGETVNVMTSCVGKLFWRVQVKSVRAKAPQRPHYCLVTTNSHKIPYSSEDIDFLVAYVFPEDAWYVFPATVVENRKTLCINPNSKRTRLEKFREAWKLMGQTDAAQNTEQSGVEQTAIEQTCTEPK